VVLELSERLGFRFEHDGPVRADVIDEYARVSKAVVRFGGGDRALEAARDFTGTTGLAAKYVADQEHASLLIPEARPAVGRRSPWVRGGKVGRPGCATGHRLRDWTGFELASPTDHLRRAADNAKYRPSIGAGPSENNEAGG
jgi:hypothetical protein